MTTGLASLPSCHSTAGARMPVKHGEQSVGDVGDFTGLK